MPRWIGIVLGMLAMPLTATAQPPKLDQALTKAAVIVEPATAAPGQTVTIKIVIELADGWYTYPTVQTDKNAESFVNKIEFAKTGAVFAVDSLREPANPRLKAEDVLAIEKLAYYPGGGTWSRPAVVLPSTAPGKVTVPITVTLQVCNKDFCFPPKKLTLTGNLTVAGNPVAVDEKYKDQLPK